MTRSSAAALAGAALLALTLSGCGSSSPSASSETAADTADAPVVTSDSPSTEETVMPKGPQAMCDQKPVWEKISAQLTEAEGALDNGPLWTDTASALGASPAPEAISNSWGPLSAKVAAYATAASSGDPADLQSAQTLQLPEIKQLHELIGQVFDQLC